MALTLLPREISTFPDSLCLENSDDSFCSDDSLWTQAMYLEKCAFESSGDSNRLFRIGVPRFPVDHQPLKCSSKGYNIPQPRMQSALPAIVRDVLVIHAEYV